MSTLPDEVRAFLEDIAGDDDVARLERDVELWKDSSDLNEAWIAALRLRARKLLDQFGGGSAA